MSIIIDLIVLAIIGLFIYTSAKRGFVKVLVEVAGFVLAVIITFTISSPLADATYDKIPTNVQPILFDEQMSGYTVGLIASQVTETNTIGFVGGMDIPSVSNFLVGFEKAIKKENSNIKVLSQYANSFTDAAKGRAIAEQMVSQGADILFACGGGVNTGVFEVTREKGIKAIGVDMPSNYISPDTIITSALKNVGTGVELTIKDLVEGNFKGGQAKIFDISNNGVGYEKTDLLTDEIIEYVENKLSDLTE